MVISSVQQVSMALHRIFIGSFIYFDKLIKLFPLTIIKICKCKNCLAILSLKLWKDNARQYTQGSHLLYILHNLRSICFSCC